MSGREGLARWHAYMDGGSDADLLRAMIAPDAVFHSPVVHTPQAGAAKVFAYLHAAAHVLGNDSFRYVRELVDGDNVMLEFTATVDDIHINGIDLIRFDDTARIIDFKVMVRPMKAMTMLWEKMGTQLEKS